MESSKIENVIKTLEQDKQYLRELEILQKYQGEDMVVSSREIQEELASQPKDTFILNSKIPRLDNLLGGFRKGQLVVISAPTGQGKTSFCQTLTETFVEKCLWFSYEVGIEEFLAKFREVPLFYLPRQLKQNSLKWLEIRIMESIAKYGTKVIFIDHLHYLLEMQRMAEAKSISLLVGMMMRDLKRMAIKHSIIIFLVSHMRKTLYDKMPEIEDLRDSSFIAQESDIVIFLKRIKEGEEYTNRAVLKVAKNRRTGKLGSVQLQMLHNKFYEYDKTQDIPV